MNRLSITFIAIAAMALTACSHSSEAGHGHDEHEHNHGGGEVTDKIELTQAQIATAEITLGNIDMRSIGQSLRVNGQLAINPADMARVMPLLPGVVKRIEVTEGQRVAQGQTLALIENTDIVNLQQEYLAALDQAELAAKELQRQEALAQQGAGVQRNLQQARTESRVASLRVSSFATQLRQMGINPAEASATKYATMVPVKAPISGTVTKIDASIGAFADNTTEMFTIVNTSHIYARLAVFEKDLPDIKIGLPVSIQLTNQPAVTIPGRIAQINPTLDAATKTATVRVDLNRTDRADYNLIPDMALTAYISLGQQTAPTLPEDAVADIEGRQYIYILEHEQKEEDGSTSLIFHPMQVKTGARENGFVEIITPEPISADARIVVANAFYITSMMADHGEHNH